MMNGPIFEIVALEETKEFYTLRLLKQSLFALLVVLFLSFNALAQSRDSVQTPEPKMILTGVVYDINGAVIADGTVMVVNDSGGKKYRGAINSEGVYQIELPLALYTIEVGAPGFCAERVERFRIVNSTYGKMSLDVVLEVAETSQRCQHQSIPEKKPKRNMKKKPNIIAD